MQVLEPAWIASALTVLAMLGGYGAWLTSQFSKVRGAVDEMREDVISKIEYHERHDDRRFGDIGDDIWAIRVQLATMNGKDYSKDRDQW